MSTMFGGGTVGAYRLSLLRSIHPLVVHPLRGIAKNSLSHIDFTCRHNAQHKKAGQIIQSLHRGNHF
jgi:hypothetical protein